ncbi:hypothetical protein ACG7TL_001753 [Trametes sanguinea]
MQKLTFSVSRSKCNGRGKGSKCVFTPHEVLSGKGVVGSFCWDQVYRGIPVCRTRTITDHRLLRQPHGRQKGNDFFDRKASSRLGDLLNERYGWDAHTFVLKA